MKLLKNTPEAIDVLYKNARLMSVLVKDWVGNPLDIKKRNDLITVDFQVLSFISTIFNFPHIKIYHDPGYSSVMLVDSVGPVITDTDTELSELRIAAHTKIEFSFLFRWILDSELLTEEQLQVAYNHPDWGQKNLYYVLSSSDLNYSKIRSFYLKHNDIDYQRFRKELDQIDFKYIFEELIYNIDAIYESVSLLNNNHVYVILDQASIDESYKSFKLSWLIYNFNTPLLFTYGHNLIYGVMKPFIIFKLKYSESV